VKHPVTPDSHYFVVRGRLPRMADPGLRKVERADLVGRLTEARRAVHGEKKIVDPGAEATAHRAVDEVKQALGERGSVWLEDESPDLNRHMAKNTPYADWYAKMIHLDHGGL
jgi:hypothetical protein